MGKTSSVVHLFLLLLAGLVCGSCEAQELEELEEFKDLDSEWIQRVEMNGEFKVKHIFQTGEGMENRCQTWSGQGVSVRDSIMYRLYDTGLCQTFDISNLAKPLKLATFELGSHMPTNHANCAQSFIDDNGDLLLYVSGIRDGKTYVERIHTDSSTLVQTITLAKMDIIGGTTSLNAVCSDDGFLWFFGSSGGKLLFVKTRRPLLDEGNVILQEDDILDYWDDSGYVYNDDVWQGGKVYNNLLFMLFGASGNKGHLAIYDTRAHKRIMDVDLSSALREEPEDCELIPQGILIVTNGGSNYYIIRPE